MVAVQLQLVPMAKLRIDFGNGHIEVFSAAPMALNSSYLRGHPAVERAIEAQDDDGDDLEIIDAPTELLPSAAPVSESARAALPMVLAWLAVASLSPEQNDEEVKKEETSREGSLVLWPPRPLPPELGPEPARELADFFGAPALAVAAELTRLGRSHRALVLRQERAAQIFTALPASVIGAGRIRLVVLSPFEECFEDTSERVELRFLELPEDMGLAQLLSLEHFEGLLGEEKPSSSTSRYLADDFRLGLDPENLWLQLGEGTGHPLRKSTTLRQLYEVAREGKKRKREVEEDIQTARANAAKRARVTQSDPCLGGGASALSSPAPGTLCIRQLRTASTARCAECKAENLLATRNAQSRFAFRRGQSGARGGSFLLTTEGCSGLNELQGTVIYNVAGKRMCGSCWRRDLLSQERSWVPASSTSG